jgi:hypothetical protein
MAFVHRTPPSKASLLIRNQRKMALGWLQSDEFSFGARGSVVD